MEKHFTASDHNVKSRLIPVRVYRVANSTPYGRLSPYWGIQPIWMGELVHRVLTAHNCPGFKKVRNP